MPGQTPQSSYKLLLSICLLVCVPLVALAQQNGNYEAERKRALELYEQRNFTEAQPTLEKLAAINMQDREVQESFGMLLLFQALAKKDPAARKPLRVRARTYLMRAKELGADDRLLNDALASLPPDGAETPDSKFSKALEADNAMRDGEAAFLKGDMEQALKAYERALQLDPQLYEAPLFMGDAYYQLKEPDKAGEWYARAIAIDPNRETAYRYWGDVLMKQGNLNEARNKFVEAFITEPYISPTVEGLAKWAQFQQVHLSHPVIEIPTGVSSGADGKTTITLDSNLLNDKDDGKAAWLLYGGTRSVWKTEKFARTFPNEKTYRHSLAEEVDALQTVLTTWEKLTKDKKNKAPDPSLLRLKKLRDEGLLESFILLARADEGIAQDHPAYLKANRDKLRRYMLEYVLTGGGNTGAGN